MDNIIDDIKRKSFSEYINKITEIYESIINSNESLIKENAKLKNEHYKDTEIKEMQGKLNQMSQDYYRGFPISEEESVAIKKWQDHHTEEVHHAKTIKDKFRLEGVSGGRWIYTFTPTAIGTFSSCRCGTCYRKAYNAFVEDGANSDKLKDYIKKYDAEYNWSDM